MAPIAKPMFKSAHADMEWHELEYNGLTLKYTLAYWGQQPSEGYPLYIGLHGGGSDNVGSFDMNDRAWRDMAKHFYYLPTKAIATADGGKSGAAYVACRGVSSFTDFDKLKDEYNLHSRPESYVLYDQMIKNLLTSFPKELKARFNDYSGIMHPDATSFVNSNQVYLVGHSAGGDGVFNLARGIPDLFAGVVASAGYACDANGSRSFFENFANLPICLQVGERDDAYFPQDEFGRSQRAKFYYNYHTALNQLQKECLPHGYSHDCLIVRGGSHGDWLQDLTRNGQFDKSFDTIANLDRWYCDTTTIEASSEDTVPKQMNAIGWVKNNSRNTTPDTVVWNLGQRPPKIGKVYDDAKWEPKRFFYWLFDRRPSMTQSLGHTLHVRWEKSSSGTTKLHLSEVNDWMGILLREPMIQFGTEVTIYCGCREETILCNPSDNIKQQTLEARGDSAMAFLAMIYFEVAKDGRWTPKLAESLEDGGGEKLAGRLVPDNVISPRL